MSNFAPRVFFADQNNVVQSYKLIVYIGHKTMVALLLDDKKELEYSFLKKLD